MVWKKDVDGVRMLITSFLNVCVCQLLGDESGLRGEEDLIDAAQEFLSGLILVNGEYFTVFQRHHVFCCL